MAQFIDEITAATDDQTPLLPQNNKDEIEEGREVTHLIGIKETNGLQTKRYEKEISEILVLIKDLKNMCTRKACTISKVHVGLSESNPSAYKPKVVSIGPYHKNNPQLDSMEKYKTLYLQRFLQRKEEIDVESCISEMEKRKDEALRCYEDIGDDIVKNFSKMLLLDGCFVVEFIREYFIEMLSLINTDSMKNLVSRDLLLVENQLPFFVLTKLHHMTMGEDQTPFIDMVKMTLFPSLPKLTREFFQKTEGDDRDIKHILQVLHMSYRPSDMKTSMEAQHCMNSLCWNPLKIIWSKHTPKDVEQGVNNMPNATELSEAGVSFQKVGNIHDFSTTLFDITFENGCMKIPCFAVHDITETFLRNLVAYEQQSYDVRPKYFSDFIIFMDYLIDSEKDVKLLRQKGIISNNVGEDNEVASLFNKIGKGVGFSSNNFYYKEEWTRAIQHCEKPWNRMKANLRRNYFHSPWAGVSTVAAIILLLLTITQTIASLISLSK